MKIQLCEMKMHVKHHTAVDWVVLSAMKKG